jgi:PIN domain nuclease of toxin-antitoxin system
MQSGLASVSVWEISTKHTLGREIMPISGKEALGYFRQAGYLFLAIRPEHGAAVEDLTAHHQDPFDRLLVAQASTETMRLVTHDATVARYSDTVIVI